ncbi:MAG: hypothetical protein M3N09_00720 [Actinomycetota bacterium]|nr:hypothetical protein [Actinomycetota bacterium]
MTKAGNERRSTPPLKRLLIALVLAALLVVGCSADDKQAGGANTAKHEGTAAGAPVPQTRASEGTAV